MADLPPNVVVESQARQIEALKAIYELEIVGVECALTAEWPGTKRIFRFRNGVADYIIAAYCRYSVDDTRELLRRLEKRDFIEVRSRNVGGNTGSWILNDGRTLSAHTWRGKFRATHTPNDAKGREIGPDTLILEGVDLGYGRRAEVTCLEDPRFANSVTEWNATSPRVTRYSIAPNGQDFIEELTLGENENSTRPKSRRGRPPKSAAKWHADERLLQNWESAKQRYRCLADFARDIGKPLNEVRRTLNTARTRRRNSPKE